MKIDTDYYRLTNFPKLFIIECYLSWDDRVAARYIADIDKIVSSQYHNLEHGVLMDLRKWELSTPQAETFINSFEASNDRLQELHIAIVANPSALKEHQIKQMIKKVSNPNIKIFEDISEAELWLSKAGYCKNT